MEADTQPVVSPHWLSSSRVRDLMDDLNAAGFEAFVVGGAVRDALLGREATDLDVSTNATPDQVRDTLKAAGWKMLPTGVEHGTWTARKLGQSFEVTTYRKDVATDGRRATVEYANTMMEDAERRDFTVNALYMDRAGVVFDPTCAGVDDLRQRVLDFVGDADTRCQEDFLRIMRLFRFMATLGFKPTREALRAAEKNRAGLAQVSGERKLVEVQKMLSSSHRVALAEAVTTMHERGVAEEVLPGASFVRLHSLLKNELGLSVDGNWKTRYVALMGSNVPFPMSRADRRFVEVVNHLRCVSPDLSWASLANVHGVAEAEALSHLLAQYVPIHMLERGARRTVPWTSAEFQEQGYEGPALGKVMRFAKEHWLRAGMPMDGTSIVGAALKEVAPD